MFAGTRQALAQQVRVSVLKPMFSFLPSELLPEGSLWSVNLPLLSTLSHEHMHAISKLELWILLHQ